MESLQNLKITEAHYEVNREEYYGNKSIITLEVEEGVTAIYSYAFCNCSNLESVKLPSTLNYIGEGVFAGCSKLEKIELSPQNKKYSSPANSNVIIENETNKIVAGCYNCTIPRVVTTIGRSAFKQNKNLKEIFLPATLKTICEYAFLRTSLHHIVLPPSLTQVEEAAFACCKKLTSIIILSPLQRIPGCMFMECESLENILIPKTVTKIESFAFYYCKSLSEVIIPSSVTKLGDAVFESCVSLQQIIIPSSVEMIGERMFRGCTNLKRVTLPPRLADKYGNENSKVNGIANAFEGCKSLEAINVPHSSELYYKDILPGELHPLIKPLPYYPLRLE